MRVIVMSCDQRRNGNALRATLDGATHSHRVRREECSAGIIVHCVVEMRDSGDIRALFAPRPSLDSPLGKVPDCSVILIDHVREHCASLSPLS